MNLALAHLGHKRCHPPCCLPLQERQTYLLSERRGLLLSSSSRLTIAARRRGRQAVDHGSTTPRTGLASPARFFRLVSWPHAHLLLRLATKDGVITLVMACVLMAASLRSYRRHDLLHVEAARSPQWIYSGDGSILWTSWKSCEEPRRFCGYQIQRGFCRESQQDRTNACGSLASSSPDHPLRLPDSLARTEAVIPKSAARSQAATAAIFAIQP